MKSRYGWAVAAASLALWVLAPITWTQAVHASISSSITHGHSSTQAEDLGPGTDFWTSVLGSGGAEVPNSTCDSSPTPSPAPATNASGSIAPSPANPTALEQTFRLCGSAAPDTQRAIEQLIAGRSFSATLVSRSDGCADLTVTVSPDSGLGSIGQQSTNLSVASGTRGTILVRIVSQNGVTHVTIGPGN